MLLANIRIVLVRPTHPGNIGATARAMKTMCLSTLYLVAPERFPGPEATALAAGAEDVLDAARVCVTLDEAIGDCVRVIGSSARERRIEWPCLPPDQCARQLLTDAEQGPVALLFGQERTGLTNDELDRCHYVVSIAANPDYSSLNIANAVQVLAYEIYGTHLANQGRAPGEAPAILESGVTAADLDRLYRHLETVLVEIGFLDPDNPRLLMRRLTRLFNRAQLDTNEYNILRGVLTAMQQARARKC
jgi:TrmH family RNA methyltransferase